MELNSGWVGNSKGCLPDMILAARHTTAVYFLRTKPDERNQSTPGVVCLLSEVQGHKQARRYNTQRDNALTHVRFGGGSLLPDGLVLRVLFRRHDRLVHDKKYGVVAGGDKHKGSSRGMLMPTCQMPDEVHCVVT